MYCSKCGQRLAEQANFCPICGTEVEPYDREREIKIEPPEPEKPDAPFPGFSFPEQAKPTPREDKISIALCVLAACFPIVGFAYWIMNSAATPRRARACAITGAISMVLAMVIQYIYFR